LFLVDSSGTVIDEFGPRYADFDLPLVDGLIDSGDRDRTMHARRAALGGRVLAALAAERDVLDRVSQIDVRDPRNAVVLLKNDEARLHLGDRAFVERVRSYLELSPTLRADAAVLDYVDLRFDSRVFVRPSPEDPRARPGAPDRPAPRAAAFD
jgi:cell division septal protein FtsQ